MSNDIHFYGSTAGAKDFIKSSIDSSNKVIEHYDFVINDISGEISNTSLEASKGPTMDFLKAMRNEWVKFKQDLVIQLKELEK